jgi:hypothetical protein
VISPFVAGSNPALGTLMLNWNKPATLHFLFLNGLELAYIAESCFNQHFCFLDCAGYLAYELFTHNQETNLDKTKY